MVDSVARGCRGALVEARVVFAASGEVCDYFDVFVVAS